MSPDTATFAEVSLFHDQRHLREMGRSEIEVFLSHLAMEGKVAASSQNQALTALVFLSKVFLQRAPGIFSDAVRAAHAF